MLITIPGQPCQLGAGDQQPDVVPGEGSGLAAGDLQRAAGLFRQTGDGERTRGLSFVLVLVEPIQAERGCFRGVAGASCLGSRRRPVSVFASTVAVGVLMRAAEAACCSAGIREGG